MPSKPNFLAPFRKNLTHGQDFLTAMRGFDEVHEANRTPPAGATLGRLAWFNIKKAFRVVGRELLYAAWIPVLVLLQVMLIVAFNLLAVMLLLRLVGVI